jgi:cytochrome c oxidase subunit 1
MGVSRAAEAARAVVAVMLSAGRRPAGADPWGSGTLEWSIPSPPPPQAFEATPVVTTRYVGPRVI